MNWTENKIQAHLQRHEDFTDFVESVNERLADALPLNNYSRYASYVKYDHTGFNFELTDHRGAYQRGYSLPLKAFTDTDGFIKDQQLQALKANLEAIEKRKQADLLRVAKLRAEADALERKLIQG